MNRVYIFLTNFCTEKLVIIEIEDHFRDRFRASLLLVAPRSSKSFPWKTQNIGDIGI